MYSHYQNPSLTPATQTQGVWNGSQWVQSQNRTGSFHQSTAGTLQHLQQQSAPPLAPTNFVTVYTDYYHRWMAAHTEYTKTNKPNEAAWAKYHADLASLAANYFYKNPGVTVAPSDLKLPPEPPVTSTASVAVSNQAAPTTANPYNAAAWQQTEPQPHPQSRLNAQQQQKTPTANTGMKRYVDRCLQATGPQHKAFVMTQVEKILQLEIQKGTLHSVNWDAMELVRPQSKSYISTTTKVQAASSTSYNQASYYGPSATSLDIKLGSASKKKKNALKKKSAASGNYYGPTDNSNTSNQQPEHAEDYIKIPSMKWNRKEDRKRKRKVVDGFNNAKQTLASRADRFSGAGGVEEAAAATLSSKGMKSSEWDKYMGKSTIGGSSKVLNEKDYEKMTIKGTCHVLEKSYLRLTAPPKAERVRPLPVLKAHMKNLKAERANRSRDYLWFCSQLKAVRQDCTVQRIQNAFAVNVYETHARIALEERDLNEYNQCQTQLKELYRLLQGRANTKKEKKGLLNFNEFVAYRLIYYVFLAVENKNYDRSDMMQIMLNLTPLQRQDQKISHALAVREACCAEEILDYHAFFCLYRSCPTDSASHLMTLCVPAMRHKTLLRICKGYRPSTVDTTFCLQELGMNIEKSSEVEFGKAWLVSCGCCLSADGSVVDTKDSVIHESNLENRGTLI